MPFALRFAVVAGLLALRELHLLVGCGLVGDLVQQVTDDVQPGPLLVIRVGDEPRGPGRVGEGEHVVASPGVVVPAAVGLEVHRRELPGLAAVVDARFEASEKEDCRLADPGDRFGLWKSAG